MTELEALREQNEGWPASSPRNASSARCATSYRPTTLSWRAAGQALEPHRPEPTGFCRLTDTKHFGSNAGQTWSTITLARCDGERPLDTRPLTRDGSAGLELGRSAR